MGVWLENLAKSIHRNFYALAALLVLTVVTLVAVDRQIQWIEGVIPFERIRQTGESIGKAAFLLGLVAVLYYGVRESYVVLRKKQGSCGVGCDAQILDQFPSMGTSAGRGDGWLGAAAAWIHHVVDLGRRKYRFRCPDRPDSSGCHDSGGCIGIVHPPDAETDEAPNFPPPNGNIVCPVVCCSPDSGGLMD